MALSRELLDKIQAVREGRWSAIRVFNEHLSKFPNEIRGLEGLESLSFLECDIRVVPDWIREFPSLEVLDLRGNPVEQVPDVSGLMLDWSSYSRLQESISPQNVIGIQVDKQVEELPPGIRRLSNLQELGLDARTLRAVPDWLPELRQLTMLGLPCYQFSEILAVLFQVPSLEWLNLSCPGMTGKIKEIPKSILGATNLSLLFLDGHNIQTPPPEVVKQGVEAIKNYWRQRQESGVDRLYEAKLIIVGEGGAGKSSLAQKIKDPTYELKPVEPTTEGIEIIHWDFPFHQGTFHVNTWDFGGQEIYHATHQFFLTRRSLYLLVADDRKEDTDFNYWLDVVGLLSDQSPLLIVQNEKQDRQRDIDLGSLRARFSNLRGNHLVNLADNRGLTELIAAIKNELQALPQIGVPLPITWRRVRERLEQDPRDHITLDEYLAICEENGFARRQDSLQLSGYLHDLGICLHFQDDPVLKNIVILKPKWGTDAVYRVLDDKDVFASHGRFMDNDLSRIWSEPGYKQMRHELLRLMMKFQLCYELPGAGSYLAPQLLSSTQPDYKWGAKATLSLRYQYEFMPKGLVSRLIVALHYLIADQTLVWKTGVILHREDTRAEVTEDRQRNRITVRASGPDTRGLIAIIDNELERLHKSFPSLPSEKYLPGNCPTCETAGDPFAYPLKALKRAAQASRAIQCQESFDMVDAAALVRDIFPAALRPDWLTRPKEVYVSYRHNAESNAIVEQFQASLEVRGIRTRRDKDLVRYKDSINAFMRDIGSGKCIIVVLSKEYFESSYCMFELTEIAEHGELLDRVFPITLDDANIHDGVVRAGYAAYWENRKKELDNATAKNHGRRPSRHKEGKGNVRQNSCKHRPNPGNAERSERPHASRTQRHQLRGTIPKTRIPPLHLNQRDRAGPRSLR